MQLSVLGQKQLKMVFVVFPRMHVCAYVRARAIFEKGFANLCVQGENQKK